MRSWTSPRDGGREGRGDPDLTLELRASDELREPVVAVT